MRCGKTAMNRNRLVAEMADAVVVAHATRGKILASGKPLYTFEHPANRNLMSAGAKPIEELVIMSKVEHSKDTSRYAYVTEGN